VSVIDPIKREVRAKIAFSVPGMRGEAIQPVGINITRSGKTGFVALGPANRIAVVDGTTHQVQKYLLIGQRVWHMAFTPDEKYLLTTNGVSNDVSVIDVASLKVIDTIQVGELPWARSRNADGGRRAQCRRDAGDTSWISPRRCCGCGVYGNARGLARSRPSLSRLAVRAGQGAGDLGCRGVGRPVDRTSRKCLAE
jgi:YVTN family beta-propeller protein